MIIFHIKRAKINIIFGNIIQQREKESSFPGENSDAFALANGAEKPVERIYKEAFKDAGNSVRKRRDKFTLNPLFVAKIYNAKRVFH